MLLHILVDFDRQCWKFVKKDIFNDLLVFMNSYLISSLDNQILITQNLRRQWDSKKDSLETISSLTQSFTVNDIGFVLSQSKQEKMRILIFVLHKIENKDYLKLLNSMYTAQRRGIKIDVFSLVKNPILQQCASVTGGIYSDNEDNCLKFLISTMGILTLAIKYEYVIKCLCHNKAVYLGLTCPVCLAVYCKFIPICKRCKSKFNFIKNKLN